MDMGRDIMANKIKGNNKRSLTTIGVVRWTLFMFDLHIRCLQYRSNKHHGIKIRIITLRSNWFGFLFFDLDLVLIAGCVAV